MLKRDGLIDHSPDGRPAEARRVDGGAIGEEKGARRAEILDAEEEPLGQAARAVEQDVVEDRVTVLLVLPGDQAIPNWGAKFLLG
jgi:hypothetical protein